MINRIGSGSFSVLLSEIIKNISGGIVLILLTRLYLSPDEYGLLSLSIAIFSAIHIVANLGIPKSAARYISEFRNKDPDQVSWILLSAGGMVFIGIIISSLGIVLFRGFISKLFRTPELYPLLTLGIFYVVFEGVYAYHRSVFQGFGKVELSALIESIRGITNLAAILFLVILGYGVAGALTGYIVGYLLSSIIGLICLLNISTITFDSDSFRRDLPQRIFNYSIPLTVTKASNILYKRVDSIMIGFFLTPMAVGFYMLAKQISSFALAPATALGFTVAPIYGEKNISEDKTEVSELYEDTIQFVLLFYLPAAVGLIFVAEPIIRYIIGRSYLDSVPVLQILAIFLLINAINQVTNDSLDYLGHAKERAIARGASSIVNFLLNLVLIPIMGVIGAAIATVLSYGMMVGVNVAVVHRELNLNLKRISKKSFYVIAVTGGLFIYLLFSSQYIRGIFTLLLVVMSSIVMWIILSYLSGIVRPDEVREYFQS